MTTLILAAAPGLALADGIATPGYDGPPQSQDDSTTLSDFDTALAMGGPLVQPAAPAMPDAGKAASPQNDPSLREFDSVLAKLSTPEKPQNGQYFAKTPGKPG